MLRSWWRQALAVVLFLLIASCSGGGCASGCSSCGVKPLAGGFPPTQTIPDSASVRVTQHGLAFLSAHIGSLATTLLGRTGGAPGVIDFSVPTSTTTTSIIGISVSFTICPNGPDPSGNPPLCVAEINIGGAQLAITAVSPDNLTISGTIPIVMRDLPIQTPFGQIDVAMGDPNSLTCGSGGGSDANFGAIPVTISLPLIPETIAPRQGYTKIDVKNAVINVGLQSSNIKLCSNCPSGLLSAVCNGLLSLLQGTVFGQLQSQIGTVIQGQLASQLCTKANSALSPACPIGSHPNSADGGAPPVLADGGLPANEPQCVYDADPTACVPTELGLEGHMNLGALLASISPGTTGALDFALAGSGAMQPVANGMTLGMFGGALPSPQSPCVPVAANPPPTKLIIPDQMLKDKVPNWPAGDPGPDIGFALDGQFLNYALGGAYNSGLLCLGVSTEKFQQLNTGLVSFLIPSMKALTFEQKSAPIAVTTRPQKPPVLTLGGGTDVNKDPLLGVLLPSFAVDFYVWTEDRYIRAFTFTADLTIPVNLQSGPTGIAPTIGTMVIANGVVTNNVLITDPPAAVATSLASVLGSLVGQLLGSAIPPINLGSALSSLGLTFTIPPGGIQKITQGTESYLGLFGDLGIPGHPIPQIDTNGSLVEKTVHPEGMTLTTVRPETAPSLHVLFGSPSDVASGTVEYSWQLDQGTWSAWSPERDVVVKDPMLYMQAKHTMQVAARLAGHPESQDATPAVIPFTIDVLPPTVHVQQKDVGWAIDAWDVVTTADALVARTRGTDKAGRVGAWGEWTPLSEAKVDPSLSAIDVEVRDEEGNVGSVSAQLIRGGPDPTLPPTGGCSGGCRAASHSTSGWPAVVLGLAGLAALLSRRRVRGVAGGRTPLSARAAGAMLALGSIAAVAASSQGCSCGSPAGAGGNGGADGGKGGLEGGTAGTQCGQGCNQPCGTPLPMGLIGAYTSVAKAADGTLWVAGYNDSAVDPGNGISALYGDLVVGKYDTTKQAVQWVTVDGLPPTLPDDTCAPNDPSGWRHGLIDSGPDVGLWTSLVLDASGHPMVAYYDATNEALKFASSTDGATWATHTIYTNAGTDAGRYAKMIVVNGNPVVAFLAIESGTNGHSRTRVTLAHASVPLPAAATDWAVEDALVDEESPCRAQDCASGQACVTTTGACTTVDPGCDAACPSGQACIATAGVPGCAKIATTSDVHPYPNAVGDYINLAQTSAGLGLLVYDRIHGNLLGLTNAGGSWAVTILDGETGSRANGTAVDTGDDGVGASLFVSTSGDWHVSYVDGITEALKYLHIPGGTLANNLVPQIVDDGTKVDGAAFSDGIHIIGDDSNVRENSDGSITITYMDATSGTLRLATGAAAPSPGKWTLHAFAQPNKFAGFFPHFEPGDAPIVNWWRWADQTTQVISGDVAIVTP